MRVSPPRVALRPLMAKEREPGISVGNGVTAAVERFAIQNGVTEGGGGGVLNLGTLTLNNSTVTNNTADTGGGIFGGDDLILNHLIK